jgi:23S rRNA G2445 N2-methylase RlmL
LERGAAHEHDSVVTGQVLADPMCGSGTFLIEAALMATRTAPGLFRQQWPFEAWPDYDDTVWKRCQQRAKKRRREWRGDLLGNDIHPGALSLAAK